MAQRAADPVESLSPDRKAKVELARQLGIGDRSAVTTPVTGQVGAENALKIYDLIQLVERGRPAAGPNRIVYDAVVAAMGSDQSNALDTLRNAHISLLTNLVPKLTYVGDFGSSTTATLMREMLTTIDDGVSNYEPNYNAYSSVDTTDTMVSLINATHIETAPTGAVERVPTTGVMQGFDGQIIQMDNLYYYTAPLYYLGSVGGKSAFNTDAPITPQQLSTFGGNGDKAAAFGQALGDAYSASSNSQPNTVGVGPKGSLTEALESITNRQIQSNPEYQAALAAARAGNRAEALKHIDNLLQTSPLLTNFSSVKQGTFVIADSRAAVIFHAGLRFAFDFSHGEKFQDKLKAMNPGESMEYGFARLYLGATFSLLRINATVQDGHFDLATNKFVTESSTKIHGRGKSVGVTGGAEYAGITRGRPMVFGAEITGTWDQFSLPAAGDKQIATDYSKAKLSMVKVLVKFPPIPGQEDRLRLNQLWVGAGQDYGEAGVQGQHTWAKWDKDRLVTALAFVYDVLWPVAQAGGAIPLQHIPGVDANLLNYIHSFPESALMVGAGVNLAYNLTEADRKSNTTAVSTVKESLRATYRFSPAWSFYVEGGAVQETGPGGKSPFLQGMLGVELSPWSTQQVGTGASDRLKSVPTLVPESTGPVTHGYNYGLQFIAEHASKPEELTPPKATALAQEIADSVSSQVALSPSYDAIVADRNYINAMQLLTDGKLKDGMNVLTKANLRGKYGLLLR